MDKIPNGTDMISQFFGERQGFADQAGAALANGIVEPFNERGLATGFVNCFMTFGRQDAGIGFEKIGIAHGLLAVHRRQGVPQLLSRGFVARADGTADHQACVDVDGPPQPGWVRLTAHTRPQLIGLDDQVPFFWPEASGPLAARSRTGC